MSTVIHPEQVYDGDLGGCARSPIGDPQSYVPSVWSGLIETYEPKSVLDLGCGLGYSTRWFSEHAELALGLDGSPIVQSQAVHPISLWDATTGPPTLAGDFDLAWCSEFVEHVEEQFLPNILLAFRRCSIIAMTHAVPGQTGHHHVNCRLRAYWLDIMKWAGFEYQETVSAWLRSVAADAHPMSYFESTGLVFERRPLC